MVMLYGGEQNRGKHVRPVSPSLLCGETLPLIALRVRQLQEESRKLKEEMPRLRAEIFL